MSRSSYPVTIAASVNEQRPDATITKSPRPASVQYKNFSKPLADDRPSTAGSTKPVGAEELQARIKAARRSKNISQPLPEAVQRQLSQASTNPDLIHPALRARSGVSKNIHRSASHQCKSREELSIEAVMRRFSAESDGKSVLSRSRPTTPGELPDGLPQVSALPAHMPSANYRPRSYPTRSRRSSMTKRPSPLSYVSSPDDTTDASSHTSRRTSASSRTSRSGSKSDSCKEDDNDDEMIRVVTLEACKSRLSKRKYDLESRTPLQPEVARPKSPPAKHRRSWHNLSRRSILCSV